MCAFSMPDAVIGRFGNLGGGGPPDVAVGAPHARRLSFGLAALLDHEPCERLPTGLLTPPVITSF